MLKFNSVKSMYNHVFIVWKHFAVLKSLILSYNSLSGAKIVTDISIRKRYETNMKEIKVIEDTGECEYIYVYVKTVT